MKNAWRIRLSVWLSVCQRSLLQYVLLHISNGLLYILSIYLSPIMRLFHLTLSKGWRKKSNHLWSLQKLMVALRLLFSPCSLGTRPPVTQHLLFWVDGRVLIGALRRALWSPKPNFIRARNTRKGSWARNEHRSSHRRLTLCVCVCV